jgi:ribosomal protein L40E
MEDILPLFVIMGFTCFALVTTIGLAYATGRLAVSKGYSFWLGFIGGIAAWLPTLIILLVIQPKGESPVLQSSTPLHLERLGTQKTCSLCNNVNPVNATSCLRCGMTFAASLSASTGVEEMQLSDTLRAEVNEGRTRVCRNCGRLNNPNRATCKSCGAEFAV